MNDRSDDTARLLLEFLGEQDAECPLCGYNLRGLTEPRCPECRQELVLTVGLREVRIVWLLVMLAPCFFSGIAAVLLLIPIILVQGAPGYILVLMIVEARRVDGTQALRYHDHAGYRDWRERTGSLLPRL